MLIAHAPTGLLLAALLMPMKPAEVSWQRWYLTGAVFGALPDVDMLWFYWVGQRQFHHHVYFTHWPIVWLLVSMVAGGAWGVWRKPWTAYAVLLGVAGMSHMVLDTVVGDIGWLKPWGQHLYSLFVVTNRYSPWQLNFIIHWSFALELALLAAAVWQWRRQTHKYK